MSYTKVVKPWGMTPTKQDFEVADLQASSNDAQEIDFEGAQELNVEFETACKVAMAATAAAAATKISAGKYWTGETATGKALYKESRGVWVLNDADSIATGGLRISRYWYSV